MRILGKVQRSQICTYRKKTHLATNQIGPAKRSPLTPRAKTPPPSESLTEAAQDEGSGEVHAPRKKMAGRPLTTNMAAYSAKKKKLQRRPEYSVWNPATSSLSASGRSNGARLQLANEAMK